MKPVSKSKCMFYRHNLAHFTKSAQQNIMLGCCTQELQMRLFTTCAQIACVKSNKTCLQV